MLRRPPGADKPASGKCTCPSCATTIFAIAPGQRLHRVAQQVGEHLPPLHRIGCHYRRTLLLARVRSAPSGTASARSPLQTLRAPSPRRRPPRAPAGRCQPRRACGGTDRRRHGCSPRCCAATPALQQPARRASSRHATWPRIAVRMLLRSCASPPASTPRLSQLLAPNACADRLRGAAPRPADASRRVAQHHDGAGDGAVVVAHRGAAAVDRQPDARRLRHQFRSPGSTCTIACSSIARFATHGTAFPPLVEQRHRLRHRQAGQLAQALPQQLLGHRVGEGHAADRRRSPRRRRRCCAGSSAASARDRAAARRRRGGRARCAAPAPSRGPRTASARSRAAR
jgi:hypothetical protein